MTIKDLARISGYSLGTVSRALNRQPNVSQKARDKILSLAMEYGYEINANAQSLKQQNSNTLIVIVKGRANELFSKLVETTQHLAAQADLPLLVDYIDEDDNEVRRAIRLCREKKPQGILFFGGTRENFQEDFGEIQVPAVLVTGSAAGLPYPGLSSVTTDDVAAARAVVQILVQKGHRSIAVIGGDPEKSEISRSRLTGCREAIAGTDARMSRYISARFSLLDGYNAMEQILTAGEPQVTAVFAMSDVMAIGAIRCLCDHGLRVPQDVSVVGFDGLPIGQYYTPKLTTAVQSAEELARTGFRVLRDAIAGKKARHVTVPYSVANGESTSDLQKSRNERYSLCGTAEF